MQKGQKAPRRRESKASSKELLLQQNTPRRRESKASKKDLPILKWETLEVERSRQPILKEMFNLQETQGNQKITSIALASSLTVQSTARNLASTGITNQYETANEQIDSADLILKDKVINEHGVHYVGYWLRKPASGQISKSVPGLPFKYIEVRHGKGKCYWPGYATYTGSWQNDQPHGHGVWKEETGGCYEGQWFEGRREGHGVWTTIQGYRYEGNWVNNVKEGWGKEVQDDGSWYEGEFKKDKKNGYGSQKIDNGGGEWRGQFRDNFRHGEGEYVMDDGRVFQGQCANGKLLGLATCTKDVRKTVRRKASKLKYF